MTEQIEQTPETEVTPEPPKIKLADERTLVELVLASDTPEAERESEAAWVRGELEDLGVKVAGDINTLGCTGIIGQYLEEKANLDGAIEIAKHVRRGLAGSGCVLPCFVGPDRFCLIHDTIGGLQEGQKQHHPEYVAPVSRALTDKEKGHIKAIEAAQRADERSARATVLKARDILIGEERESMANVAEEEEDLGEKLAEVLDPGAHDRALAAAVDKVRSSFSCPEHGETFWRCRFCVAQAIVAGDLEMNFFLFDADADALDRDGRLSVRLLVGDDVEAAVGKLQDKGASSVSLFARVARWRRKLARE